MIAYIARRIAYLIPIWLGLTVLAFLLSTLAGGDPARNYFQRTRGRQPSPRELAIVRERFGLDEPLPQRYVSWLRGAVQGDLGDSFTSGRPVTQEIVDRFPATLQLATAGTSIAILIAIPIGILAALHRNSVLDQVTRGAAMLGASIPSFWLALLLIILFSVKLQWLPSAGRGGPDHIILPALALGLGEAAIVARLTRSSLLEVLGEDYVTTARAKGIPQRQVILRHALRNALTAVVTEVGLVFGFLLAEAAIVEIIFVWPGIGRMAVEAIGQRDYNLIQGFVVFTGTVYLLMSLVVDLVYLWLDPRVALGNEPRPAVA